MSNETTHDKLDRKENSKSKNPNQIFHYEYLVKEADLDSFGHINNATYFRIYEEARWDFITKNGYGHDRVIESKIGPVILEANIKYRREILNRSVVKISSQVESLKSRIMVLNQWMTVGEVIVNELRLVIGLFDLKERKMIFANDEWKVACGMKLVE